MKDRIKKAYTSSKNIYDDVLTQKSVLSRFYVNFIWHGVDDVQIAQNILSCFPDDFCGSILDVPVGTAVFTAEKWHRLKNAEITCLDYSQDMLAQASEHLADCDNVHLEQGDVGNMPFQNESFDIVLSMNGFHAFPDKKSADDEIWRVLKPGGRLIACFYIKGKSAVTDLFVNTILAGKGWFTRPFQTEEEVRQELKQRYIKYDIHVWGSIIYFCAEKTEA